MTTLTREVHDSDGRQWLDPSLDLDTRVNSLLADLSTEERCAVAVADWSPLVPRLRTRLRRRRQRVARCRGRHGFPAGIALAATFDDRLAQEYGAAVGAEVRASAFTVLAGWHSGGTNPTVIEEAVASRADSVVDRTDRRERLAATPKLVHNKS